MTFSEFNFSVSPTVSVDGAEVTGIRGVAVVENVTTFCSGENPILRKTSALVTMYTSGLSPLVYVLF